MNLNREPLFFKEFPTGPGDAVQFFSCPNKRSSYCGLWLLGLVVCAWLLLANRAAATDQRAATTLTSGSLHALSLGANGTISGWGDGYYGQLGMGWYGLNFYNPVFVTNTQGVVSVAAGGADNGVGFSTAARADGAVLTWGFGYNGQLGNGIASNSAVPILAANLTNIIATASGGRHALALRSDGTVWAWGNDSGAELGNGGGASQLSPIRVAGLTNIVDIAAGTYHSMALRSDGRLFAWGTNANGELGDGTTNLAATTPELLNTLSNVVAISSGGANGLALKADGSVWQWGTDSVRTNRMPVIIAGLTNAVGVAAGDMHSLVLLSDGSVWAWGDNRFGFLGDGTKTARASVGQVVNLPPIIMIAAGKFHSVAMARDGATFAWGANYEGELGNGQPVASPVPVIVNGVAGSGAIVRSHTVVAKADGSVYAWGDNGFGQLGNGTTVTRSTPAEITQLSEVTTVAAGSSHSLAVKTDGSVWAWGANYYGQLGNGTSSNSLIPTSVNVATNILVVSAGDHHSLAVTKNRTVLAWGANTAGQIGDGTATNRLIPVAITSLTGIGAVAAGSQHSLAISTNGSVWAWGADAFGQLGDGNTTNQWSPESISGISHVVAVAAGNNHSLALDTNGTVWAWGNNAYGQLGVGDTTNRFTPVAITNLGGVTAIACGGEFSAAISTNGSLWMWGCNLYGQLATGDSTNRWVPMQVSGISGVVRLQTGEDYVIAIMSDGSLRAWGGNLNGQLGAGFDGNQFSPVTIPGFYVSQPPFSSVPLNVLATNGTRFVRGSGNDSTYESFVIPLDFEKGIRLADLGNNSNIFSGIPWFTRLQTDTRSHLGLTASVTNGDGSQVNSYGWISNFVNPIVAFGSSGGGSSLSVSQPFRFGAYAGFQFESTNAAGVAYGTPLRILVYRKADFIAGQTNAIAAIATNYISIPRRTVVGDQTAWNQFLANGLSVSTQASGLSTTVQLVEEPPLVQLTNFVSTLSVNPVTNTSPPPLTNWNQSTGVSQPPTSTNEYQTILTMASGPTVGAWGVRLAFTNTQNGAYLITHTAQSQDYCYVMEALGVVPSGTNVSPMVVDATGTNAAWCRLYSLDFDDPSAWRSLFVSAPQFNGTPLPSTYLDSSPAELNGLLAVMTNSVILTNSIYTNLDNSPELRRNPTLDSFVQNMGSDPIALASYVQNQIELTDALSYNENTGQASAATVNQDGVNRGALGVYLEGQGSPIEQCSLLVYLLRQAGFPAAYVFPTNNNMQILDTRLSTLLRMQIQGAVDASGNPYSTNSLITVNYPWVVAQIGTNLVNLFPWLKDTEMIEGLDLYDYLPTNYNSGAKWFQQYILGDTNILSLNRENDTPSILFPEFIQISLLQNHPEISLDDLGMSIRNRQHAYARWQDFPVPNALTNQAQVVVADSLTGGAITNVSSKMTNVFDTIEVQVYSVNHTNNLIDTGEMRLVDLHNRKFLIFTNAGNLQLWLAPYLASNTNQSSFGGTDPALTNLQTLNLSLTNGSQFGLNVTHRRHKAINPSAAPARSYLGVFEQLVSTQSQRFVQSNDVTAIILNVGRVTQKMVDVHAQHYWLTQEKQATSTASALIQDYQGTAAYLMGMDYFRNVGKFMATDEQLHKVQILSWFGEGLCKLTYTNRNSTNMTWPTLDIYFNEIAHAGNGTTHLNSGNDFLSGVDDFATILLGEMGAQEHHLLNMYYGSTNAISSVQLLRWAQQRSVGTTNSGIIELNQDNYVSLGNSASSGYGTTLLKNYDTNLWTEVTNAFGGWDANFVRAYITPAPITNGSGVFKKMAAVVMGLNQEAFLCSGNLNDGEDDPSSDFTVYYGFDYTDLDWDDTSSYYDTSSYDAALSAYYTALSAYYTYYNTWQQVTSSSTITSSPGTTSGVYGSGYYSFQTSVSPPSGLLAPTLNTLGGSSLSTMLAGTPVQSVQLSYNNVAFNANSTSVAAVRSAQINQGDQGDKSYLRKAWDIVADPVDPITGAFHIEASDLHINGPIALGLERNYSSQNLSDMNNFGYGWRISCIPYLRITTNGTGSATNIVLFAAEADGSLLAYRMQASNTNLFIPMPLDNPDLDNNTISRIGSTANMFNARIIRSQAGTNVQYVLNAPDGSKRVYQVTSFSLNWTNNLSRTRPYLQTWTDSRGNSLTFSYGTNSTATDFGQLNRIQSGNGSFMGFYYNTAGYITEAFTEDDSIIYYDYDDYGDLVTVTLPDMSQINYEYNHYTFTFNGTVHVDSDHTLVHEIKPEGRRLENVYDSQRRVVAQLATVGQDLSVYTNAVFTYSNNFVYTNSFTNFTSGSTFVTDVNQNVTRYDYTNNLITQITDPLNQTIIQNWFFTNDNAGGYQRSLNYSIDKRHLTNTFKYDAFGNVTNLTLSGDITGTNGGHDVATWTCAYNTNNLPTIVTDPNGIVTSTWYDTNYLYLPNTVLHTAFYNGPAFASETFWYTAVSNGTTAAYGLLQWQDRAQGFADFSEIYYDYNPQGFCDWMAQTPFTTNCPSSDPVVYTMFAFGKRGELLQISDSAGRSGTLSYDEIGRVTGRQVYESNNPVPVYSDYFYYNQNGNLTWYDGPRSNPEDYIWYDYDAAGRQTQEIHWRSQGNSDGSGVSAATSDSLYATTFAQYDKFGNLINVSDQLGNTLRATYDAIGQMTGKQHFASNSPLPVTSEGYAYEPGGLVTVYTNALGGITSNLYTATGQLKFQQMPDGSSRSWAYDLGGRLVRETLANGSYLQTVYDVADNRVTNVLYNFSNTPLATNIGQFDMRGNLIQSVDAYGNVFSNSYDGLDRIKTSAGPANGSQNIITYTYDGAGKVLVVSNALSESMVSTKDALGRPIQMSAFAANNAIPVRVTSIFYSPDYNSMVVTNGTGTNAIVSTTYTDTQGNQVLSIESPTNGITEFTWRQYDILGNCIAWAQCSSNASGITIWATNGLTYDCLNRVQTKTTFDGATTVYSYDALGDVTNYTMPDGLSWSATYLNDGRISSAQELGGGLTARSMTYSYYGTSSPVVGRLQTLTDGRGTIFSYTYDDFTRLASVATTGFSGQQQTSTVYQYDLRNLLTNLTQSFSSNSVGPSTTITRGYDAYGHLLSEGVSVAANSLSSMAQTWDAAGRRSQLNGAPFNYQVDGQMIAAGSSVFGYADNGLLTSRTSANRAYGVNQRDGRGRILQATTMVGGSTALVEALAWRGDGSLANYVAARGDFTDTRNYLYSQMAQRLTQESFDVAAGQSLTNTYTVDNGASGGLGILTAKTQSGAAVSSWSVPSSGGLDGLSRVTTSQNSLINRTAYGLSQNVVALSATLDGNPVGVQFDGLFGGQWRANLDLSAGTHTLSVAGVDSNGISSGPSNSVFTVTNGAADTNSYIYDGNGNVIQRLWISSGVTNRIQTLTWDAFDRLIQVTDRDTNNSGFNFVSIYDGFGRRVRTIETMVTNGTPISTPSNTVSTVDSWYDPQVEFLETAVNVNGNVTLKTYGPDANQAYGGLQGTGGLEAIYSAGASQATGLVQDYFGNVIGTISNNVVAWSPARFGSYGPVPGYQTPSISFNTSLSLSLGWRGRRVEDTGLISLGARQYDPVAGRFMSADPFGHLASKDLYSYCGGDPVNFYDADGRFGKAMWRGLSGMAKSFGDTFGPGMVMAAEAQNMSTWALTGNKKQLDESMKRLQAETDLQNQQFQAMADQYHANLAIQDGSRFNATLMTFDPAWGFVSAPYQLNSGISLSTYTIGTPLTHDQKYDVAAGATLSFVNTALLADSIETIGARTLTGATPKAPITSGGAPKPATPIAVTPPRATTTGLGWFSSQFVTRPNMAYFWSGLGRGGDMIAANLASKAGGTTLEMLAKEQGIQMPVWNAADPVAVAIWDQASAAFARSASGTVRVVLGDNVSSLSVWKTIELPALQANESVSTIISVNPATGAETIIFKR